MRSSIILDWMMQKVCIFFLCHMKGCETSINFHKKTWHQTCHVFMLFMLLAHNKVTTTKTYFLYHGILVNTNILHYMCYYTVMFPCSNTALFQSKRIFMKLTNFFVSRTKQIYAKTLTVSESTFKVKRVSYRAFFEILLTSAVICKHKPFAWKRDCAISSKLQIPRRSSWPF